MCGAETYRNSRCWRNHQSAINSIRKFHDNVSERNGLRAPSVISVVGPCEADQRDFDLTLFDDRIPVVVNPPALRNGKSLIHFLCVSRRIHHAVDFTRVAQLHLEQPAFVECGFVDERRIVIQLIIDFHNLTTDRRVDIAC